MSNDTSSETDTGDAPATGLTLGQAAVRIGAIAAVLSAILAVTANLSEIAGWFTPDETREIIEETRETVAQTDARINDLLMLMVNQAAASGVELELESEATIRHAIQAIIASGNQQKRDALAHLEAGDVNAAAEAMSRVASDQASAVSETGAAAAASWLEAAALYKTYDFNAAIHAYQEALRLQPDVDRTLDSLGHTYVSAGRYDDAEAAFRDVLARNPELAVQSSSQYGLGGIALVRGDYELAAAQYELALTLAEQADAIEEQVYALRGLGHVARARGDRATARDHLARALTMAESLDNERLRGHLLVSASILAARSGEFDEAEAQMREVLAIREAQNDRAGRADALGNLGALALSRGDTAGAKQLLVQTVDAKAAIGWDTSIVYDLINLGSIHAAEEDFDAADEYLARAEALATQYDLRELTPIIIFNRGEMAAQRGDPESACRHFAAATPVLEAMGSEHAAEARTRLDADC